MDLASVGTKMITAIRSRRLWRASGLLVVANAISNGLALARTSLLDWLLPKQQLAVISGVVGEQPVPVAPEGMGAGAVVARRAE